MSNFTSVDQLIASLEKGATDFNSVIQLIESKYDFTPSLFKNGSTINQENTNNGSCKIFAFGKLNQLSEQATLNAFGDFYTKDVLQHPDGDDHQNIRNFMKTGWQGIDFEKQALALK